VKLSREGVQFTAENGEIRVIRQEREFEKTKEGVFLKFKNPQKSYDALKSGQASIVLMQGNKRQECLLTKGEYSVQINEGNWEVCYVDFRGIELPLGTLTLMRASER
jgi:hypothetical protein